MNQTIQLNNVREIAIARLDAMHLDADLIDDASGQTNGYDHWLWLASAPQRDILDWVASMGNDMENDD